MRIFPIAPQTRLRLFSSALIALAACSDARDDVGECAEDETVYIDVLRNDGARAQLGNVTTPPKHGIAQPDGDKIWYAPSENYHGEDSFEYEVSWAVGRSARARVTVNVTRDDPQNTTRPFALPYAAFELATLDVDGDGRNDVLTMDRGGNLSLLRATDTAEGWTDYTVTGSAFTAGAISITADLGIAVGDWNRDGADDALLIGLNDVGYVAVLGPATTADALVQVQLSALPEGSSLDRGYAIGGDFDGDGEPDLIVRNDQREPLVLFTDLRIDETSLRFAQRIELDVGWAYQLQRVDADGDGIDDLLVVGDGVRLWLGSPAGLVPTDALRSDLEDVALLGHDYPSSAIVGNLDGKLLAASSFGGTLRPTIPAQHRLQALRARTGHILVAQGSQTLDFYCVDTSTSVDVRYCGDISHDGALTDLSVHDLDGDGRDEVFEALEDWNAQTGERSDPRLNIHGM